MYSLPRIVSCSLSPNTTDDDVREAWNSILRPLSWNKGNACRSVIAWLSSYFKTKHIYLFSSGRSACTFILEHFGIGTGDEVIIQAFTCAAVPNSVRFTGATPVYADIDASLNLDENDVRKKITEKTKAIIIQHSFGNPARIEELLTYAKKHTILIIEDLAHAFGSTFKGRKLGTFGDAAFLSFGRDKVLSSVMGGAAIFHTLPDRKTMKQINHDYDILPKPSRVWIFQQLFHPIAFSILLPLYSVLSIGKIFLVIFQKLHLLTLPVTDVEKKGVQPVNYMEKFPNALAMLLIHQLKKFELYKKQRISTCNYYGKALMRTFPMKFSITMPSGLPLLRYPIFVADPVALRLKAKSYNILLGNWYHDVIDPKGSDKEALGYHGDCPRAEFAASHIVNLPTRIPLSDAIHVYTVIRSAI